MDSDLNFATLDSTDNRFLFRTANECFEQAASHLEKTTAPRSLLRVDYAVVNVAEGQKPVAVGCPRLLDRLEVGSGP